MNGGFDRKQAFDRLKQMLLLLFLLLLLLLLLTLPSSSPFAALVLVVVVSASSFVLASFDGGAEDAQDSAKHRTLGWGSCLCIGENRLREMVRQVRILC